MYRFYRKINEEWSHGNGFFTEGSEGGALAFLFHSKATKITKTEFRSEALGIFPTISRRTGKILQKATKGALPCFNCKPRARRWTP
jgi:hypothetical protein